MFIKRFHKYKHHCKVGGEDRTQGSVGCLTELEVGWVCGRGFSQHIHPMAPIQGQPGGNGGGRGVGMQQRKIVSTKNQCEHRPASGGSEMSL